MSRRFRTVLLVLLLVAAGCVGLGSSPTTDGDERRATVVEVIDGDTVEVRFADGTADTVRLLGVDSPEPRAENRPEAFEGVPDTDAGRRCLREAAHGATAFAEAHLHGASVTVVVDEAADRRDRYGRLLAYVVLENGTNVNYRLVESGHARVYPAPFSHSERFSEAEAEARAERRGLWECRDPGSVGDAPDSPLRVVEVHADAAGNDHENLGDEYVTFRNVGNVTLELTGWTVTDEGGHAYAFPDGFELPPGETVTLYSGEGTYSEDALYWGATGAVWNNDGDTVIVRNESGTVVVEYRY